jgi:hypothetical protein
MPLIQDPDLLVVGTELSLDTTAKTIGLNVAGNLIAKDGVTMQALYSKLIDLWTTATYNKFPFPMYTIDSRSGQFQLGTDGATFNGWKFLNDTSRQMIRNAGWSEFSNAGALQRQYVGIVALASGFPAGSQFYYQRASGGTAINFTFTDSPNEGIQVFGDATNGNFDNRTFFKIFCREQGYTFDDAVLGDVGETSTGAFKVSLPLSVGSDLKITAADGAMIGAPYSSIIATYYGTNQNISINGTNYPFRVIIDGASATLEQIYTKIQYLLRQSSDIDSGAGSVTGKTANSLCYFVGDTLYTTQGVFIQNIQAADLNRVVFLDQNSVQRTYAYVAAGTINFNSFLQGAGSYYRMYFTAPTGAGNDYGESGAITVNDASAAAIAGTISGSTVSFTFDYDGDTLGGTAGTDKAVTVVAGRAGFAKPVVATGTLTRSKTISISLVAEQERAYLNP